MFRFDIVIMKRDGTQQRLPESSGSFLVHPNTRWDEFCELIRRRTLIDYPKISFMSDGYPGPHLASIDHHFDQFYLNSPLSVVMKSRHVMGIGRGHFEVFVQDMNVSRSRI